ncbi:MAG TPA: universal stress protein [Verrucomicrobiae bacterium]|nr:universal stress protein [Verrucomicrobiae bacterium]
MYQNILLCTDGSPAADVAGDYAIWFAKKLNAHLRALYVTDVRLLEGPWIVDFSGAIGAQPYTALLPQLQQIQREKAETVLAAVESRCQDGGVACETSYKTGSLAPAIAEQESGADIIVLGQRGEHAAWLAGALGSSVERVVRASVKPCLVTPDKFRPIRHMLIAYDGSAESSKALRAGIALAPALGAQVTITMVAALGAEDAAFEALHKAKQQATEAGVTANAEPLHGDAEIQILELKESIGADLVVMGAYGHTRIRELILGSTTSHVLRKSDVPVLLVRGK